MKEFLKTLRKELETIFNNIKLRQADGRKLAQSDLQGSYEIDTGEIENADPNIDYCHDLYVANPIVTIRYFNEANKNKLNAKLDETKAVLKVVLEKSTILQAFTDFEIKGFSAVETEDTEAKFELKLEITTYIKHGE